VLSSYQHTMQTLSPEQIAAMTPEQVAAYIAAQIPAQPPVQSAPAATSTPASDILNRLNASAPKSAVISHTLNLKVEFVKDAQPTKTGLSRKLVKFAEIGYPFFVLLSAINGNLKEGNSYPVEMIEKPGPDGKTYFNITSIKGDRAAAFDTFDYLLQRGDTRAAFSLQ
jgi:hypothetical protein